MKRGTKVECWPTNRTVSMTSSPQPSSLSGGSTHHQKGLYLTSVASPLAFSLFGVGASSLQSPVFFFALYSFLIHMFCTSSLHLSFLSFGVHSLQSSMFSLLHLALSFSPHVLTISIFHVLITTSCSVFLST